mgnify:CR=1 FL=1
MTQDKSGAPRASLSVVDGALMMVGIIWFVQIVHYPLFAKVGESEFASYEHEHTRRTGWVVAPLMLTELATALLLLGIRPLGIPLTAAIINLMLVASLWVSTWLVQIPCHHHLTCRFDPAVHRRLVGTNWFRTAVWSLRGLLVLGIGANLLGK